MEKSLWMVSFTHMFIEVYLLIQVALIPVYIREFHLTLLEASLVASVPSLVQLLANIPSGFLVDRFNPKHLLFASLIVEGFSALVLSQTTTFWALIVGVGILKISVPLYHISGLSQISEIPKQKQISRAMGLHNALGSLGSAIGLITLTVFLSTLGWRWTYLCWALPILGWALIILRSSEFHMHTSRAAPRGNGKRLARLSLVFSAVFLSFLVAAGLRDVSITTASTFLTTYFVNWRGLSEATASLIFGLGPFVGMVGSLSGGYLGGRLGTKKALSLAILGSSISLSILSFLSQLQMLALMYISYSFFSNTALVPMNSIAADIAGRTERGVSFGVYFFTEGVIASVTPVVVAALVGIADIWYIFPFSIAFLVASLIVVQLLPQ